MGFSRQKAPITPTKSINNSAQLCAEFEPAPQCARLTLSALTRQGNHLDELLTKTTESCPLEINTHAFNHGQQKNVEKVSQTLHFLLFFSVSRSRLSVATATRSSSAGLEGTLSFLPNGRTSNLPTSKNRVGIRFSVD